MASILFVDDDPFTLTMLEKSVQLFGHQALLAQSGGEAVEKARQLHPDLILTDMNLTDMDGLELVRQLGQGETAAIPVVMLSANPASEMEETARQAGAKEYLAKPVGLQKLMDVIKKYTT